MLKADMVSELDTLSLRDRLNQLKLSAADERWINGITAGQSGGSSSDGAFTALAQWRSLAGWNTGVWYRAQSKRVSTGMSSVVKGDSVEVVTASGQKFTARTVVVAVPVNVWKTITFNPGLPSVHATATRQGVGVANSRKLWLHVTGDRGEGRQRRGGRPLMTVLSHNETSTGQLLMALTTRPVINVTKRAEIEAALRTVLPVARLVDFRAQDWGADSYSMGGWALRRPGQMSAQLPSIQQPHGRLTFATSDIANGWVGFVEGALEAGFRAASQAAAIAGVRNTV
ncbi:MAG TPA: FAD-dependent oxidoreductase [Streptomyces sp.]